MAYQSQHAGGCCIVAARRWAGGVCSWTSERLAAERFTDYGLSIGYGATNPGHVYEAVVDPIMCSPLFGARWKHSTSTGLIMRYQHTLSASLLLMRVRFR